MLDYPDVLSLAVAFLYLSPTFLGTSGETSNILHRLSAGHLSRTSISMHLQEAPHPVCKVYPDVQPQLETSTHGDCFGSSMAVLNVPQNLLLERGVVPLRTPVKHVNVKIATSDRVNINIFFFLELKDQGQTAGVK